MKKDNNKFSLYEIVEMTNSPLKDMIGMKGFVMSMNQFPWNGMWEYYVHLYDMNSACDIPEENLISTGKFLSDRHIEEHKNIMSSEKKFDMYEIVRIKGSYLTGEKGFIVGMAQSSSDGSWGYALWVYSKDHVVDIEEYELESTGEFLSEEEIKKHRGEGSSMKVTQEGEVTELNIKNPKNWRERTAKPENVAGFMSSDEE